MTPRELWDIRHTLEMSQQALAERLGLSRRQIIRYETGESEIPPPVAIVVEIMVSGKVSTILK